MEPNTNEPFSPQQQDAMEIPQQSVVQESPTMNQTEPVAITADENAALSAVGRPTASAPIPDQTSNNIEKSPVVSTHKASKKRGIIVAVCVVVVLAAAGAWAVYGMHLFDKKTVKSTKNTTSTGIISDKSKAVTDPELKKFITPTTGETWLATPKTISGQGYLKSELASTYTAYPGSTVEEQMKQNAPVYQEVGTHAGKTIILATLPAAMENPVDAFLFEKDTNGSVAVLLKPQARATITDDALKNIKDFLTSKITIYDTTTHYDSLAIPSKLSLAGNETVGIAAEALSIGKADNLTASDGVKYIDVSTYGDSQLKRVETTFSDTKLTNIGYKLVLPTGTAVSLTYTPNGSTLEGYSFANGATTQVKDYQGNLVYDPIIAIARGCSLSSAQVTRADNLKVSDLTVIGKTASGSTVYAPTDTASGLYKKAYDEYKQMFETDAASFETYQKDHGLLLIQNAQKELLVYVRESYAAIGGCAKPVVYLYPTKATFASVMVGANVTVSDPAYPATGWQGVWAEPNGKLTYLGKSYDSLFWEGQGYGEYPAITSGTVVRRANVAKTMRSQLSAQGLNTKETNDFMAFWEAKIPNKPYVRLTWLGTSQMNALAPLTVSPKPQTVIRVFLDMDGFDTPIQLPAQKLTKVERSGFTVVEWGGLTPLARH